MKKESNGGLFFLLAVGIVGLGLYFAAAEDYSAGELQLYHIVCWAVLIAALLRVLELIWGPVRRIWDQAWEKTWTVPEKGDPFEHDRAFRNEKDFRREKPFRNEKAFESEKPFVNERSFENKKGLDEEEISRADGVIIMPDRGSRLYLDDRTARAEEKKEISGEEAFFRHVPEAGLVTGFPAVPSVSEEEKTEKKNGKKKNGKKKKKK